MWELWFIGGGILVCIVLCALSVWAVLTKPENDVLKQLQNLSDKSAALAESAVIWRMMGMHKEAEESMAEAVRLDTLMWAVINGEKTWPISKQTQKV